MMILRFGSFGFCSSKFSVHLQSSHSLMIISRYGRLVDDNRESIGFSGP
jgi:hypothetical protein